MDELLDLALWVRRSGRPPLRLRWLSTAGPSPWEWVLELVGPQPGLVEVEVEAAREPLLASCAWIDASCADVDASRSHLGLRLWQLEIPFPYRGRARLRRVWAEPRPYTLVQELPLPVWQDLPLGAASGWVNASQADVTADCESYRQRGELSWVRYDGSRLYLYPIPAGLRRLRCGTDEALERCLPDRGQLPELDLYRLGLWLWALAVQGQESMLAAALRELVYYWGEELGNLSRPLSLPGLPLQIRRDGSEPSRRRDVAAQAWLGYHLVHTLADLRGRVRTLQLPTSLQLLERLRQLLRQLGWWVANAVHPIDGWAAEEYDERGFLSDRLSVAATVYACLFLESLCTLEPEAGFHERAALAWLALWLDARSGDLLPRLVWAARYEQRQRLDEWLEELGQQPLPADEPLAPLLSVVLPILGREAPPSYAALASGDPFWSAIGGDRRRWTRHRYGLHSLAAYQNLLRLFQLSRWMLPYGYRWFSHDAEYPYLGRLGALLYALVWNHFHAQLRLHNLALAPYVLPNQGVGLTQRGRLLRQLRQPLEPDSWYRERCLHWCRQELQTATALCALAWRLYGLPLLVEERALRTLPQELWLRLGRLEPDPSSTAAAVTLYVDASWDVLGAGSRLLQRLPLPLQLDSPQPVDASTTWVQATAPASLTLQLAFTSVGRWRLTFQGGSYNRYAYRRYPLNDDFYAGGPLLPLTADALEITADRTRVLDYRSVESPTQVKAVEADAVQRDRWTLHWQLDTAPAAQSQSWALGLYWGATVWLWQLFYHPGQSGVWQLHWEWQGSYEEYRGLGSLRYRPLDASCTQLDLRYGRPGWRLPFTVDRGISVDQTYTADQAETFHPWPPEGLQLILRPYEYYPELEAELLALVAAGVTAEVRPEFAFYLASDTHLCG